MRNLARRWVRWTGKTIAQAQQEYDGCCIDFAGDFIEANKQGRLAYFNDIGHPIWKYHAAVEIDGMIHDLWFEAVLPTEQFLSEVLGGGWVDYPGEATESEAASS